MTKPNRTQIEKWKLTSIDPVYYEGWYIKASMTSFNTYMVVLINEQTDNCYTGFFANEHKCNQFIEKVLNDL